MLDVDSSKQHNKKIKIKKIYCHCHEEDFFVVVIS